MGDEGVEASLIRQSRWALIVVGLEEEGGEEAEVDKARITTRRNDDDDDIGLLAVRGGVEAGALRSCIRINADGRHYLTERDLTEQRHVQAKDEAGASVPLPASVAGRSSPLPISKHSRRVGAPPAHASSRRPGSSGDEGGAEKMTRGRLSPSLSPTSTHQASSSSSSSLRTSKMCPPHSPRWSRPLDHHPPSSTHAFARPPLDPPPSLFLLPLPQRRRPVNASTTSTCIQLTYNSISTRLVTTSASARRHGRRQEIPYPRRPLSQR
jgi:hypothetical protein